MSVLKATARRVDNGLTQRIDIGARHTLVTDEPARLGGTDAGPTPHELLPAALAGCIATMIAMYARTKNWDLGEFAVEVDYENEAVPRRFKVDILIPRPLSAIQLARLERVADTCPLRRALETGFEFDERILAEEALELAPTG